MSMSQYHVVEPSAFHTDFMDEWTLSSQKGILDPGQRDLLAQMRIRWTSGQQNTMLKGDKFHSVSGHIINTGPDGVPVMFRIDLTSVPIDSKSGGKYGKNAPKSGNNDIAANPDDDYA